jgi:leucyl-tRNA synthetase
MVLGPDGQKMSKSRGNVIAPDDVVNRYGADTVRCYLMFMGPFDQGGPWNHQGIEGVWRFMNRVWALVGDVIEAGEASGSAADVPEEVVRGVVRLRHKMVQRLTGQYADMQFNTALAALMEFVNGLNRARDEARDVVATPAFREAVQTLVVLLAPLAPYISEELWHQLGGSASVHLQPWPTFDEAETRDDVVTMVVQVNGKVRDRLVVPVGISEEEVRQRALASPKVAALLDGASVKKLVYVPDKLVNLVI